MSSKKSISSVSSGSDESYKSFSSASNSGSEPEPSTDPASVSADSSSSLSLSSSSTSPEFSVNTSVQWRSKRTIEAEQAQLVEPVETDLESSDLESSDLSPKPTHRRWKRVYSTLNSDDDDDDPSNPAFKEHDSFDYSSTVPETTFPNITILHNQFVYERTTRKEVAAAVAAVVEAVVEAVEVESVTESTDQIQDVDEPVEVDLDKKQPQELHSVLSEIASSQTSTGSCSESSEDGQQLSQHSQEDSSLTGVDEVSELTEHSLTGEDEVLKLVEHSLLEFTSRSSQVTNLDSSDSRSVFQRFPTVSHKNFHLDRLKRDTLKRQNYHVTETIGYGTYGKVYKASRNDEDGRLCALKVMDMDRLSCNYKKRFLGREIAALRSIAPHENIVACLDVFRSTCKVVESSDQDGSYRDLDESVRLMNMAFEYCPNGDLYDYLSTRRFVPQRYAGKWFGQLLAAVGHIHRNGFAHRDLKPENCLFDDRYNLKVADFGFCYKLSDCCAKCEKSLEIVDEEEIVPAKLAKYVKNRTFTACGSPMFSSPELFLGGSYSPVLNDVWACGVILYDMLFGSYPDSAKLYGKLDGTQALVYHLNQDGCFAIALDQTEVFYGDQPELVVQINRVLRAIFTVESKRLQIPQIESLDWVRDCACFDPLPGETDLATIKEHFAGLNTPVEPETESFEFLGDSSSDVQQDDLEWF